MKNIVQVRVSEDEFKDTHEKKLSSVLNRVQEIVPENSTVDGRIMGTDGLYEGHIHIRSRVGAFVAKAKAKNLFSLIAKLQSKTLRQIVNWREKKASKKRYHSRKHRMKFLEGEESA